MRKQMVISLGGGCDVAMILNHYQLRHSSLPFDWLWNLHDGLGSVTSMIQSGFDDVRGVGAYSQLPHYRWPGQRSIVFRDYPHVAHVHTNPLKNPKALATFERRIDRMSELLEGSRCEIAFVYYRQASEGPETLDHPVDETILDERIRTLGTESRDFVQMMSSRYPSLSFRLLSVLSVDEVYLNTPSFTERFKRIVDDYATQGLRFDTVVTRPEGDRTANKLWQKQWGEVMRRNGVMSRMDEIKSIPLSAKRRLRQMVPKRFRRNPTGH